MEAMEALMDGEHRQISHPAGFDGDSDSGSEATTTTMSLRSILTKQYKAVFARWPKDQLRELKLPELLSEHLDDRLNGRLVWTTPSTAAAIAKATGKAPTPVPATDLAQLRQVNALLSLLDDRYMKANRVTGGLMTPRSNPTYYQDIITELDEAPTRSFLGRVQKKLQGMFRFS